MDRAQIAAGIAGVFFLSAWCGFGQQPDSSSTAQTVPRVVKFTGVLSDVAGKPLSGPADVTFSLYKEQSGGEPLWWETQTLEADAQGRYTVLLGATRPEGLPIDIFASGEARWLAVQVGKEPEQPRVLLVSVPYALKAEEAEKLGGKRATDFVLAEKLKEEVKTAVAVEVQQVGQNTSEQVASEKGPQPLTGAEGPTDFTGSNSTQIVSATQTGSGKAVYGLIQNGTSGATAVRGETNGTAGFGVLGIASATTGTATGVRGYSDSPNGVGVSGYLSAPTGYNYAVYGLSRSTQGRGVLAQASATSGPTAGVLAQVSSLSGTAGIFRNTASGKLLRGEVGAVAPYTQVFSVDGSGNVAASGGVSAATGSFTGAVTGNSFTGSGAGLTSIPESALAFNPATQTELDAESVARATADTNEANLRANRDTAISVRGINYIAGCDSCDPLTDSDDQNKFYVDAIGSITFNLVACYSDAGSPVINIQRFNAMTVSSANMLASDLTCSPSGPVATTFAAGQDTLNTGDALNFLMVSAGGTAKRVTVVMRAVLN